MAEPLLYRDRLIGVLVVTHDEPGRFFLMPDREPLAVLAAQATPRPLPGDRALQVPLMRGGLRVAGLPSLAESRAHLRRVLVSVPWEGLKLSAGEPAIPTVLHEGP